MDSLPWPKKRDLISAAIVEGGCVIPMTLPANVASLLRKMTNLNPRFRPTAEECLKMPLFHKNEEGVIKKPMHYGRMSSLTIPRLFFEPKKTKKSISSSRNIDK